MTIFDPRELCLLADAYCAATGTSPTGLQKLIGVDDKLFSRLERGAGCRSKTLIQVSRWFASEWPADVAWPDSVRRPSLEAA